MFSTCAAFLIKLAKRHPEMIDALSVHHRVSALIWHYQQIGDTNEQRHMTPLRYAFFLQRLLETAQLDQHPAAHSSGSVGAEGLAGVMDPPERVTPIVADINSGNTPPEVPCDEPASRFWTDDDFPTQDQLLQVSLRLALKVLCMCL